MSSSKLMSLPKVSSLRMDEIIKMTPIIVSLLKAIDRMTMTNEKSRQIMFPLKVSLATMSFMYS